MEDREGAIYGKSKGKGDCEASLGIIAASCRRDTMRSMRTDRRKGKR